MLIICLGDYIATSMKYYFPDIEEEDNPLEHMQASSRGLTLEYPPTKSSNRI